MNPPILRVRGADRTIDTTLVMGVINASPESFSDAGRFSTLDSQLELAETLIAAGADVLDVGGQSAITGVPEIDAHIEIERVIPIVEWIRSNYPAVLMSVDTYKPRVVEASLAAGADIINDVSGLRYPEVAKMCAHSGAALVVMHTAAPPKVRKQDANLYGDIGVEVRDFLKEKADEAVALGIPRESLILDPGPDFAKTPHQTLALLREIDGVRELGRPLLLALSRKDFLGAITGRSPRARGAATDAALAHFAAVPGGIARVHDVAAAVDVIATIEALNGRREIPVDYLLPDEIRHEPQST
ncbi:MAG: dihydropteroate synthase [Candidatus Nanopelagicales bacterium]